MEIVSFSERLREVRLSLGYSQQDLANFLGTSKQVISRYETGQRTPKISVAAEYAQKLNVDLTWFLGGQAPLPSDETSREASRTESLSDVKQLLIDEIMSADDADIADLIAYLRVKKGITPSGEKP